MTQKRFLTDACLVLISMAMCGCSTKPPDEVQYQSDMDDIVGDFTEAEVVYTYGSTFRLAGVHELTTIRKSDDPTEICTFDKDTLSVTFLGERFVVPKHSIVFCESGPPPTVTVLMEDYAPFYKDRKAFDCVGHRELLCKLVREQVFNKHSNPATTQNAE